MAVSRAMRRLLRVLGRQEEQCQVEMEAALADLRRLESALNAAGERDRTGRRLVSASATTGEMIDRLAGLEESHEALQRSRALSSRIAGAQETVIARRERFLSKRVERRQAETVVEKMQDADVAEAGRRGQRELDDWFLGKVQRGR
jgi:flagellar export protein FliJ